MKLIGEKPNFQNLLLPDYSYDKQALVDAEVSHLNVIIPFIHLLPHKSSISHAALRRRMRDYTIMVMLEFIV